MDNIIMIGDEEDAVDDEDFDDIDEEEDEDGFFDDEGEGMLNMLPDTSSTMTVVT